MTVSEFRRRLDPITANAAYRSVCPDLVRTIAVRPGKYAHLLSSDPLTAGNEMHAMLKILRYKHTSDPLTNKERAYLPWLVNLRQAVWSLGAWQMDVEVDLDSIANAPDGVCDLVAHGGPQSYGIIELKVFVRGSQKNLRGIDLAQLGSYARLRAGRGSYDRIWCALAYLELESGTLRFHVFKNSRQLISETIALQRAA